MTNTTINKYSRLIRNSAVWFCDCVETLINFPDISWHFLDNFPSCDRVPSNQGTLPQRQWPRSKLWLCPIYQEMYVCMCMWCVCVCVYVYAWCVRVLWCMTCVVCVVIGMWFVVCGGMRKKALFMMCGVWTTLAHVTHQLIALRCPQGVHGAHGNQLADVGGMIPH